MTISLEIRNKLAGRAPGHAVLAALERLVTSDAYLLIYDANERSVSHRFGVYLQSELPQYHVDCEYNRTGVDPKRVNNLRVKTDICDTDGRTVFPDVIVHLRGCKKNYLVVELKKSTSAVGREFDLQKLRGYKGDSRLNYEYALFIELAAGGQSDVSYVEWIDG